MIESKKTEQLKTMITSSEIMENYFNDEDFFSSISNDENDQCGCYLANASPSISFYYIFGCLHLSIHHCLFC